MHFSVLYHCTGWLAQTSRQEVTQISLSKCQKISWVPHIIFPFSQSYFNRVAVHFKNCSLQLQITAFCVVPNCTHSHHVHFDTEDNMQLEVSYCGVMFLPSHTEMANPYTLK
jgi:hypothetical protein